MRIVTVGLAILAALGSPSFGPVGGVLRAQEPAEKAAPLSNGVFLSGQDYSRGVLTSAADCKTGRQSINLHTFWNRPYIDVKNPQGQHRFNKQDIFGFRDCSGRDHRFFSGHTYRIVEPGPIYLYTRSRQVPRPKGHRQVTDYFFSIAPDSPVIPLTKANLKTAYPENHRFHDLLDATFQLRSLSAYDDFHKMYRINHLLLQTR